MKAHKYWSIGALITMIGTFYTGYKGSKSGHRYFACSTLICMIMSMYTGHKMISGNKRTRKHRRCAILGQIDSVLKLKRGKYGK